jgi:hypothetical protein
MIDVENKVMRTPSVPELVEFLSGIDKIDTGESAERGILRIGAFRMKEIANKAGLRCGWADAIYKDAVKTEPNKQVFAMNIFPTTGGDIYYNADMKQFCSKPKEGAGSIILSPKVSYIPNVKDGSRIRELSESMMGFTTPDNVDCVMWKLNITKLRLIYDPPNAVRAMPFEEVDKFIRRDDTYSRKHVMGEFQCFDFGVQTRDRAVYRGIRSAVIILFTGYRGGQWKRDIKNIGTHVMNAFDTSDKGVVYIEPQYQHCYVAEPAVGSDYTEIINDALQAKYVNYNRPARVVDSPNVIIHREIIW